MPISTIIKGVTYLSKRFVSKSCKTKHNACELMRTFDKSVASTYCPLPAIMCRGCGVNLYDVEGKEYLDFVSGYGSANLGHCHPKILKAVTDQVRTLTQASREVYTKALIEYGEYVTELFCYDKVLPMNSGTEAAETAVKLARKWGYKCKGICANQAKVIVAENNCFGSSIAGVSASTDPCIYSGYGPFTPGFDSVPFSDLEALEYKIVDPNVCAFMIEPVQTEAGVVIPDPCYLKQVRDLCTRNRVLLIADEIHCGLGRCGCLLCCDIYRVRPDILVIGKALGGGVMPVSAILADADVIDFMEPGTHSSTFGGSVLGCHLAMTYLKIIQEERIVENAREMGEILRGCLCDLPRDIVNEVRGVGLLNAIVLKQGVNAADICLDLLNNGILVKSTKGRIIRLCPPLIIKQKAIVKAAHVIRHCIENSRGACDGGSNPCSHSGQKSRSKLAKISNIIIPSKPPPPPPRPARCSNRGLTPSKKGPRKKSGTDPLHAKFLKVINHYTES